MRKEKIHMSKLVKDVVHRARLSCRMVSLSGRPAYRIRIQKELEICLEVKQTSFALHSVQYLCRPEDPYAAAEMLSRANLLNGIHPFTKFQVDEDGIRASRHGSLPGGHADAMERVLSLSLARFIRDVKDAYTYFENEEDKP